MIHRHNSRRGDERPNPGRLYRNRRRGWFLGVCAGIADYFGTTPCLVRSLAVVGLILFPVPTVVGYLVMGFLIDDQPENLYRDPDDARFWQSVRRSPSDTFYRTRRKFMELEQRLRRMEALVTSSEFELRREINRVGK